MRPSTKVPFAWTRKELRGTGAITNTAIWTPATGNSVYVHKILATVSAASEVVLSEGDDASGTRVLDIYAGANGGLVVEWPHEAPLKLATNAVLKASTTAGNSKFTVYGFEAKTESY